MPADTSPPNFETLSDEKPGAGVTEEPLEAHDTLPAELATGDKLGDGAETMESDESNEVKAQVKTSPRAWAVLIATFTAQLFSWGFLFAGGIWQRYFFQTKFYGPATQAELAWIGSIAYTVCMVFGMFIGRICDVFGHRPVFLTGVLLYAISFLLASFTTAVWQLYLTHGVLWGASVACLYIPASGISVQWWTHRIAFSISITGMGSGIGGFVWPNALQAMLDTLGPRWAYRIMAALGLVVLGLCGVVLKPLHPPKKAGARAAFFDGKEFFGNKHYWLLSQVAFWLTFGYYTVTYYGAQYATDVGLDPAIGSLLIAVMNGSALVMRLVQAPLVKYVGSNTCFFVFVVLGALCQLVIWPFAKSLGSLMAFSILYGIFATGGCFGFFPIVIAETFLANYASALGLIFVWCAPGGLIGPVVSGILFDKFSTYTDGVRTTSYLAMQMFGGSTLFVSGLFALWEMLAMRKERGIAEKARMDAKEGKRKVWYPV